MGYRSDVGLALTKNGVDTLHTRLDSQEVSDELRAKVEDLLNHADEHYVDKDSGAAIWYWEWIKWYGGNSLYYEDIKFIEDTLKSLNDDDYRFIRIGEEYDDTEMFGDFWENPFDFDLSREIRFSEPA